MSLVNCPECGHSVSESAIACPNCGRPLSVPVVERRVVPAPEREGLPKWAYFPLGLLGAVLVVILFVMFSRNSDEANSNIRVGVETQRPPASDRVAPTSSSGTDDTAPPMTSAPSGSSSIPESGQSLSIPGSQTAVNTAPQKGSVVIDARIITREGSPQPVRNERFYLLDEDIESILSDARLEPIEGNTLMNSLGLSILYPDRYGDFNRRAMAAIKEHIKYAGTTDGSGKAQLGGVDPSSYYLFGVTKSPKGFAVWSSPVTIISGENNLNLSPVRLQEIENRSE